MGMRDRLKKTFSRRSSSATTSTPSSSSGGPNDRTSSIYYQPGEKIPYKYRRPVEPKHKAQLEGFTWKEALGRKSMQSQYSPMGSRMPSRQGSHPFKGSTRPNGSVDSGTGTVGPRDDALADHLETIQSVQSHSPGGIATTGGGGAIFTQEELEEAMKKAGAA